MRTPWLAIAMVALAAPALPAKASDKDVTVRYDDLDLTTRRDRKELERRIDVAARIACNYQEMRTGTRVADTEGRECYRAAKAAATGQFAAVVEQQRKGG